MKGDASGNLVTVKGKHPLSGLKADEMEAERYLQQVLLSNSLMTGLTCKLQTSDPLQGRVLEISRRMCFKSKPIIFLYPRVTLSEVL